MSIVRAAELYIQPVTTNRLTCEQMFTMAFMGIALVIDDTRRGRHQWDMSLLDYLQTTEVRHLLFEYRA